MMIFGGIILCSPDLNAQTLQNGCDEAGFGIDADTRANISLYGNAAAPVTTTDDWFWENGSPGVGVIDTTGGWLIQQGIQAGNNVVWLQGMAYPKNSVVNGRRLHDASYARDYYGGNGATDLTSFKQASKNGEDPDIWDDGPHNVLGKNDLIDCYAHLRRDGLNITDNLWLYLGFSRIATNGESYFDAELYVQEMTYDAVNGFPSGGPDAGHTAWAFDAFGNIIKVGDMITTCEFSSNSSPVIQLRIWVSRFDFLNTDPATFNFGGEFDGDGNGAAFGYADIEIPTGSLYGCGLGNPDFSAGPPWGTLNSSATYSLFYDAYQFVEVGLDLTVFGIDPVLLYNSNGTNICELPYSNIIFKARSSNSFTAQLKDFAGPFPFNYTTEIPVTTIAQDTVNCYEPVIDLFVQDTIPGAYYSWTTVDGNILTNPNHWTITVDEPGTYIVTSTLIEGCEGAIDTIVVINGFIYPPGADISFETNYDCNAATHLTAHPDGYLYSWTGPGGFTSTSQDVYVTTEGLYYVEVINAESGCSAIDSIYVVGEPCQENVPDTIATTIMLDTIPPDFTVPVDITIDCNADPIDLTLTGNVTDESDNCDINVDEATFTDIVSDNYPCAGSALIQRVWVLTDHCGNVNTQTQLITVTDTTAPTFDVAGDVTIDCTDDIDDLTITGEVTNIVDDCDSDIVVATYSDVTDSSSSCDGEYNVIRTWVATDDCGNSATATQTITVIDTIPPVFSVPADITIECDINPDSLAITGDVYDEYDSCDSNIGEATYTDVVSVDDPCVGAAVITRTWSLTDECNNTTTAVQTITLEDTTAPVLIIVGSEAPYVECDTLVAPPVQGVDLIITDNCDNNVNVTFSETTVSSECPDKYTIRRVWIATDGCNNQDSIVQEFQVQDTENPIVIVLPDDLTLQCHDTIPDGNALVDDNCADEISISFSENIIAGSCTNSFVIERTWTWTDNCGNTETHMQYITIEDNTPPDFTAPEDITLDCSVDPTDLTITGQVTGISDNCDVGLQVAYSDSVTVGFPCEGSSLILRTWTLADSCGNTTEFIQQIELIDTIPPVFTVPADITISCDQDPDDLGITGDVTDESDNCMTNVGEAIYNDSIATDGYCDGEMTIYRTWELEDDCGNISTALQTITVEDNTSPTMDPPADITINCTDDPFDLTITGEGVNISDDCSSGVLSSLLNDSLVVSSVCDQNAVLYRTWYLEDACGNDTSYVQIITIQDTVPPVFTAPEDITLDCEQDYNDLLVTGQVDIVSDNCDNNLGEATFSDLVVNDDLCNGGLQIDRTWTMTDACGNSSSIVQHITVVDTVPPLFSVPPDITISCDQEPTDLTITGDVIDESDNCDTNIGEANYSDVIITEGICTGAAIITRTWKLADACGNATSAVQTIILEDTTPPIFSVPADLTLECDQDPYDLSITGDVFDEWDNCTPNIGEAVYEDSILIDSATCLQALTILRYWVLVDGCGNFMQALQTITVEDTHAPAFPVPVDVTLDCGTDYTDLTITGDVTTIADNCDTSTIVPVYADSVVVGLPCDGATTVYRKWSAVDICGNDTLVIQTIVLQDTFPPTILTVPVDTTVNCDAIPLAPTLLPVTDSCGGPVQFAYNEDKTDGPCLDYHTLTRTWTATDDCGNVSTATQLITVINCGPDAEILLGPDTTVCEPDPVSFEVVLTTGYDTPNYQWQFSPDGGATWQDITFGGNFSTYHLFFTSSANEGLYRCLVSNDIGSIHDTLCNVITDEVALFVNQPPPPVELNETICDGDTAYIAGNPYTTTGSYTDTISAINGCDSIITLNLTVNPIYNETVDTMICQGDSYQVGDSTYTSAGTHTTVMSTIDGCDSTIVLNLTVNPIYNETVDTMICQGDSYQVGDSTYTSAGTHTTVMSTVDGCDSIIVLNLTVNPIYNETVDTMICMGDSYQVGDSTYTTTGTHTTVMSTIDGCDSTIVLNLTVNPIYNETVDTMICQGDSYQVGDSTYTTAGTHTTVMSTIDGCDSTIVLNLTVNPIYNETVDTMICQGDSYQVGDSTYTSAGTHTTVMSTVEGCDSTIVLNLTVNPIYNETVDTMICQGDSYQVGDSTYTTAGTHTTVMSTIDGCDSTIVLNLTVNPIYNETVDTMICQGDSYQVGDSTYTTAGTHTTVMSTIDGCDSTIVLNLMVNPIYNETVDTMICQGDSYQVGDSTYTTAGTHTTVMSTIDGCDSTIVLNLTVNPIYNETVDTMICQGDSYQVGDSTYTTAGTHTTVMSTIDGCDSTIVLNLMVNPIYNETVDTMICQGDSYQVGDSTYTTAGTHTTVMSTIDGCDSTIVLNLTVNPIYNETVDTMICQGDSYQVGDSTYTTAGTHTTMMSTIDGCDSTIVLNLTVNPIYNETVDTMICQGDSYQVGDSTYTSAGTHTTVMSTIDGCDSTIVLNLTVNPIYNETVDTMICMGDSYQVGDSIYTTTGTHTTVMSTIDGCDSTIVLNLTVNPIYNETVDTMICQGDSYQVGDSTYTSAGTHTTVMSTVDGCDSTIVLNLTVNPIYNETVDTMICQGDSYQVGDSTYTTAGTHTTVMSTIDGCDSTIVLNLTVNPIYNETVDTMICQGDSYQVGDSTYTSAGTHTTVMSTVDGCDSTIVLNLTVNPIYNETVDTMICQGDSYQVGDSTYTTAGTHTTMMSTIDGCDSTIVLNLTVNPIYNETVDTMICQGDSYQVGDSTYTTAGTHTTVMSTVDGCDSIIVLNLTVNPIYNETVDTMICQGDSYQVGDSTYTSAGTHTTVMSTIDGCDSTIVLNLTVNPIYNETVDTMICQGDSYQVGDSTYTSAGTHTTVMSTIDGCDSTIVLNLTVNPIYNETVDTMICQGDSYQVGDSTYTSAGTHTTVMSTIDGCDSTIVLNLTVNPIYNETVDTMICQGDSYQVGDSTYTSAGTHTTVMSTIDGCDSTIVLNLTVNPIYNETVDTMICMGDSYQVGDSIYTTTGTHTTVMSTIDGCDSTIVLNLTVNPIYNETVDTMICQGDSYQVGDSTYTSAGTHTTVMSTVDGCDSTIVLNLTVNPIYNETVDTMICQGDSYQVGDSTYTTAGTHTTMMSTIDGCDSTIVLNLTVNPIYNETVDTMICQGDSYQVGDSTYTTAGTHTTMMSTIDGCDSTIVLNLTVNPIYNETVDTMICQGDSYQVGDSTYTTAGTHTTVMSTIDGCDSTIVLNLTVNPIYNETVDTMICQGDSYQVGDSTYTTAGTHTTVMSTVDGCDSTIVLNLTVNPIYNETVDTMICQGDSYQVGDSTYTSTGTHTTVMSTIDGCDSTIVLNLTVNPIYNETVDTMICQGDSYQVGDSTYTTAGTHTTVMSTIDGCDSTIVLNLTVNPIYNETVDTMICEGGSYQVGDSTYTTTGTWTTTLTTAAGCDSTVVLNLTVNPEITTTLDTMICEGGSIQVGDSTYTTSGSWTTTLTTADGCDSTVVLNLTVNPEITTTLDTMICEGGSIQVGDSTYTTSGSWTTTLTTADGCDSTVVLNLTVNPEITTTLDTMICEGGNIQVGDSTYTTSGSWTTTLTTADGCDSTVVLNLTVNPEITTTLDTMICEGGNIQVGDSTYTTSGSWTTTLTTADGCDSTVVLNLTVNPEITTTLDTMICEGGSIQVGDSTYTTSGSWTTTLTTADGCDSTVVLNLTVNPEITTTLDTMICEGGSIQVGDSTYTTSGSWTTTLTTADGCDSTVVLNLTVNPEITTTLDTMICEGGSIQVGDSTYTTSGSWTTTLTTADGCDSTIVLNLTVNPEITETLDTMICEGGSYQVGDSTYTTTGTWTTTLTTADGCDSTIVLNLTVSPEITETLDTMICEGGSYQVGDSIYTTAGTWTTTMTTADGCDSTIVLNLVVNSGFTLDLVESICEGDTYQIGDSVYTTTGTWTTVMTSVNGCDSIINLDLTVYPVYEDSISAVICTGGQFIVGDSIYNTAGTHTTTMTSELGCDSIIHVTLSINDAYEITVNEDICEGETYMFGDSIYSVAGTYVDTFTAVVGCDSIVTLNLMVHPVYTENLVEEICQGEGFTVGDSTYTSSGTYTTVLTTAAGCDSTIVLDLTVHPTSALDLVESICEGDTYQIGDSIYTTTGTWTTVMTTVNGCDSIINLDLTVYPIYDETLTESICEGDSYQVGDSIYTTSGTFVTTLATVNGCDSIITLNLTVNPVYTENITEEICHGDSFTVGDSTYTASGTYTTVLTSVAGCDSTIVLDLTVHPTFALDLVESICEGDTYQIGDSIYTTTGTWTTVMTTVNGCDSIINLDLTVYPVYDETLTESICEGDSYQVGDSIYTTSGTFVTTLATVNGCDSIITLNLTVNPVYTENLVEEICQGEGFTVGDSTYTASGTYTTVLTSVAGCDSTIVLDLTVHPTFALDLVESICEGDTYQIGDSIYTTTGTWTTVMTTVNGCDSIINLDLMVYPIYDETLTESICEGDSYQVGDSIYTTSGTFVTTLATVNGCDSIITLNLTVNPVYTENITEEICQGDSFTVGDSTYTSSGTYTTVLTTAAGCDSTIVLDLTVHPTFALDLVESICEGDTYQIGDSIYTTTGTWTTVMTTVNGCDSIINLDLTVYPIYDETLTESICEGDSYQVGDSVYTTSGTFVTTLATVNGCDSLITLNLTVNPVYTENITEEICQGDSFTVGDSTYTASGTYTTVLTTVAGCDSTIVLDLTVHPTFALDLVESICEGDTYQIGDSIYTTTGTWTTTMTSINGCDSIINLDLTVYPIYDETLTESICEGDSYQIGDSIYTTSGTFVTTLATVNGCDSIITLNLTVNPVYTENLVEEICQGEGFTVGDSTYTASGTYTTVLTTAAGCDSTIVLDLTVHPIFALDLVESICEGDTYQIGDSIYTTTGTWTTTMTTVNGCDSIINLDLTVYPIYDETLTESICEGDSYQVGDSIYTTSGTFVTTLATVNGCDSIITLNLTVNPVYTENITEEICQGDSFTVGDSTYTASGTYTTVLTTAAGCDSTIVLDLTVHPTFALDLVESICEGDTYQIGDSIYTTTGTWTTTMTSINGCDSIINLDLTVYPIYDETLTESICEGDSYQIGDSIYTTSGTFVTTLATLNGCDSIITLNLTVNPVYTENLVEEICQGEGFTVGDSTYTASGTYTTVLTTAAGCDSTIVLDLTVHPTFALDLVESICEGDTYQIGDSIYTTTGTWTTTMTTVNGCDSIINLDLTVYPIYDETLTESICEGESYQVGDSIYTTNGTFVTTLATVNGCDSLITLNLTVNPVYTENITEEICEGDSFMVGDSTYTSSGTYTTVLTTAAGCDSTIVLDLTVHPTFALDLVESICEGDTYQIGDSIYTTTGTWTTTMTTVNGCDSIINLDLTVYPIYDETLTESICEGESYQVGDSIYTTNGTFVTTLATVNGCDSLITLNLTVNPVYTENITEEICEGDSFMVGDSTYTSSGTYTTVLTTAAGCDSTIVLDLTVHPTFALDLVESICEGDTYQICDSIYTTTGTWTTTMTTVNGCDSIINLDLTVYPVYDETLTESICEGDSYQVGDSIYTTSGTYTMTLATVNGCDSLITLNLTVNPVYTENLVEEICQGDSFTVGDSTYTASGTYTTVLTTVAGCDSTIVLDLTVHPTFALDLVESICEGDTYQIGDSIYTTTGTWTTVMTTVNGCDSIINLDLTVYPIYDETLTESICEGDSYQIGDSIYTTSGTFVTTLATMNGCDSIITLNLTVNPVYTENITEEICEGDSFMVGDSTYTSSGTYTTVLTTAAGCDSTIVLDLTVHPTFALDLVESICEGDTYQIGDSIYTTTGTWTTVMTTVNGCDSIINLDLTVYPVYDETLTESICEGDSYQVGDSIYTTSGTFVTTLATVNGCDSIITLNLTVNPVYTENLVEEICQGEGFTVGDSTYTASGTYTTVLTSVAGCDSTIVLDLTVHPTFALDLVESICEGDTYQIGDSIYTTTGTWTTVMTTVNGCDSIINLDLTVYPVYDETLTESICEGDSYQVGDSIYTTSGTFVTTLATVNGCDSIITLNLTVNPVYTENLVEEICQGEGFTVGDSTYTASGTYTTVLTSVAGCDSTIVLDLTVHPTFALDLVESICEGDTYQIGDSIYTTTGTWTTVMTTVNGCDSIINLDLMVYPIYDETLTESICEGDSYQVGDSIYTTSGTFVTTLATVNGCDSIITLNLTVNPVYTENLVEEICQGEGFTVGDSTYTSSGTYTTVLTTAAGCDSTIVLDLTVHPTFALDLVESICQGDTYQIGDSIYTTTGTWTTTMTTVNGCDSIINLDLTVYPIYDETLTESICEGDSYQVGDSIYTTSGTFVTTLATVNGCDSIITLNLTVNPVYTENLVEEICQGEGFTVGDSTYTASGTYTTVLTSVAGCDSTIVLDLTVHPTFALDLVESICEGDTYQIGDSIYTTTGTWTTTMTTVNGCDSIINLDLTVYPIYDETLTESICEGDSYQVGDSIYTTSGVYTTTLYTDEGCDSIVTLNLTVHPVSAVSISDTICEGDQYVVGDSIYTTSGTYTTVLTTAVGCDSVVTLDLTVYPSYTENIDATICEGESYTVGNEVYNATGVWSTTLETVDGCDSIVVLNLVVHPTYDETLTASICEGDSYPVGDSIYTTSGTYTTIMSTVAGCDSIVTVDLTVLPVSVEQIADAICEGEEYVVGDSIYTTSGIYTTVMSTVGGCDSTVVLDLTVHPTYTENIAATICAGGQYEVGNSVYDTEGVWVTNILTANGCDSTVILTLTVNDPVAELLEESICQGENYFFDGVWVTDQGVYYDTLSAANGCDSVVVLQLFVENTEVITQELGICEGDSLFVGGAYQTTGGMYTDTYTSGTGAGCDSVVHTTLVVWESMEVEETHFICEGDSMYLIDAYYSNDTILSVNYNTYHGCDSVVVMYLEVLPAIELLGEDYEICLGESVELSVMGADEVHWSPINGLSCVNCSNPQASPTTTTTYTVTAEGCQGEVVSTTVTVVVNDLPDLNIISDKDRNIVLGDTVVLQAVSNDPFAVISWTDSEGNVHCEDCNTIEVMPVPGMDYIATAYNADGCEVVELIDFNVRNDCDEGILEVPNFITPNGDSYNDELEIRANFFNEVSLIRIYNRWGELVFETKNVTTEFWDGTFLGKPLNPDVYVYYIEGFCLNGDPFLKKGNVTILK